MALRLSKTVKLINLEIFSIWEMAYPSSSWADPLDSPSFCYNDRKLWCYKVGCLSNSIKFINHFLRSNFKKHNINVIRVICPVYNLHTYTLLANFRFIPLPLSIVSSVVWLSSRKKCWSCLPESCPHSAQLLSEIKCRATQNTNFWREIRILCSWGRELHFWQSSSRIFCSLADWWSAIGS